MHTSNVVAEAAALDLGSLGGASKQLQSGAPAQWRHLQTLRNHLDAMIEAHPGRRVFIGLQSGYSTDIPLPKMANMGDHAASMKESFVKACAERSERLVAVRLRKDLKELASPELVAKVVERLLELFVADGIIGRRVACLMLNSASRRCR